MSIAFYMDENVHRGISKSYSIFAFLVRSQNPQTSKILHWLEE